MSRKLLSLVLALTMLLSMSVTAFASDSKEIDQEVTNTDNIEFVNEIKFKSLPELDINNLVQDSSLPSANIAGYSHFNLSDGNELNNPLPYGTTRSITQSWTGTLANEGEFTYVLITLAPTQILNSTLISPQNASLNYDLFVYEVDANGNLGNVVASSTTGTYLNTYPDGATKTVDEGAAFINNTSQTKDYAVIVSATQGGSSTDPFKLTISLDVLGNYDAAEPNDSAYNAYAVTEGTLSGASLHVVNDQDWYIWRATSEFKSAKIAASAGYKVEVYTANGNKMVLVNQNSDGSYPIASGVNYIKVFADESSFTPSVYSLSIEPWELTPAKMLVHLNGDQGDTSYPKYPQGSNYLRFKDKFYPEVGIASASGYGVPNHPVKLYWESGSWNEHTGNKTREVNEVTDAGGVATLVLEKPNLPISLGKWAYTTPGAIRFTHYYDIDGIIISSPGVAPFTTLVYHFSHSVY